MQQWDLLQHLHQLVSFHTYLRKSQHVPRPANIYKCIYTVLSFLPCLLKQFQSDCFYTCVNSPLNMTIISEFHCIILRFVINSCRQSPVFVGVTILVCLNQSTNWDIGCSGHFVHHDRSVVEYDIVANKFHHHQFLLLLLLVQCHKMYTIKFSAEKKDPVKNHALCHTTH